MLESIQSFLDPATLRLAAIPLLLLYVYVNFMAAPKSKLPRFELRSRDGKQSKWNSLDDVMRENYAKDRNFIYQVEQPHKDIVIIPAKYVDEIKSLPDEKADFLRDINERFLGEYSKMLAPGGLKDATLTVAIKNELTPKLNLLLPAMQAEIAYAFEQGVGACADWTAVVPLEAVMRIIALVSGRIFVGPELNRQDEYVSTLVGFAVRNMMVTTSMRKYPAWLRPVAEHWDANVRKVNQSIEVMSRLIEPLVEARRRPGQEHSDMLAWAMACCPPDRRTDLRWQAMYMLQIGTASIHVTSTTVTHLWFDLAARPAYLAELRAEIEQVAASEPGGRLGKTSLPRLRKLDSFMKESMRLNPFSVTGFSRKVMTDLTMADGTVFPAGITITAPVSCISMDPDIYPDPATFDGLRFCKLRDQPGCEAKYQYVATNKDTLNWGHGNHACPGRFFANNEIKFIMSHLILHYDIKLPDGEGRPQNIWTEGAIMPDATKAVLFKAR